VVVTPNSTLSWAGAVDMIDVPMDLRNETVNFSPDTKR
jgi:hypothetical protein